ncbi:MAG TPA: aspartate--tRNA(Asn) ligase, partial [Candidatus Aenigmarchaeota archaeon]|nr:aspartate--tRNA(Asn) ligase [Candidatus Aenigmarchaeota archaeon]
MKKIFTSQLDKKIGKKVRIEGWVHDIRLLGGIAFVLLRDKDGIVQVTVSKKKLGKEILKEIEKLHQEDVIRVEGKVVRSKIAKRGIEIIPSKIEIISKSKSVLPLDPRGITKTNLDTQLDWRFLYFRTEEGRSIFRIQTQIVNAFRKFFLERGFIEMQPPCIIASASEGGAELFPLPYFEKKAYLAQSPQLYKQMGAISFERVFMVVPVFRAEKFDQPTHLNEIRQMDVEIAFADYEDAMRVLEECLVFILKEVKKNCKKELEI